MERWQSRLHQLSAGDGWTPGTYRGRERTRPPFSFRELCLIFRRAFPDISPRSIRSTAADRYIYISLSLSSADVHHSAIPDVPGGMFGMPPAGERRSPRSSSNIRRWESLHCLNCEITRRARGSAICATFLSFSIRR